MGNNHSRQENHFQRIDLDIIEKSSLTLSRLCDLFRESTGLDAFFFYQNEACENWEQKPLYKSTKMPLFCKLLQRKEKFQKQCLTSHKEMALQSIKSKRPVCQHCHAGLLTFHYPILIDSKGKGVIQTVCAISQRKKTHLRSELQKKLSSTKTPVNDVSNAVREMRIISKQQTAYLIEWLELIVNYLAESTENLPTEYGKIHSSAELSPIDYPEIEYMLRHEIGQSMHLPAWRAQRSTGCSAAVIEKVIEFIGQNYSHPLSSQVIAQALGFEPSYFSKMFKQHAKKSFTSILREIRLNKAKALLCNPHLSIQEVTQQSGFSNPSFFTSVFRNAFNLTPTQFRSQKTSPDGP